MKLIMNSPLRNMKNRVVQQRINKILLGFYLTLLSISLGAEPYSPKPDEVVAQWPVANMPAQSTATMQKVVWHLDQSRFAGQGAYHFSQANILFYQLPKSAIHLVEYHYLAARLLQHQHKFSAALEHLDSALSVEPRHVSVSLLKANIHIIQEDLASALAACKSLVGNASMLVAMGCSLEVSSYHQDKLEDSYRVLSTIVQGSLGDVALQDLSASEAETHQWLVQLAADMAIRLQRFDEAQRWLGDENLADMPLSYIVLWADVQLMLGKHQHVLDRLGTIVNQEKFKNDALLVRLAMAQKAQANLAGQQGWIALAKQRIELRIRRDDGFHAADIARFFLYVQPEPKTALYWAKVNYQQAKLFDDRALLTAAQQAVKTRG
jgi:hypothetical protein